MWNESGESAHPCLVPDVRGRALRFSLSGSFSVIQNSFTCRLESQDTSFWGSLLSPTGDTTKTRLGSYTSVSFQVCVFLSKQARQSRGGSDWEAASSESLAASSSWLRVSTSPQVFWKWAWSHPQPADFLMHTGQQTGICGRVWALGSVASYFQVSGGQLKLCSDLLILLVCLLNNVFTVWWNFQIRNVSQYLIAFSRTCFSPLPLRT